MEEKNRVDVDDADHSNHRDNDVAVVVVSVVHNNRRVVEDANVDAEDILDIDEDHNTEAEVDHVVCWRYRKIPVPSGTKRYLPRHWNLQ